MMWGELTMHFDFLVLLYQLRHVTFFIPSLYPYEGKMIIFYNKTLLQKWLVAYTISGLE
jgi:hypothetical protein